MNTNFAWSLTDENNNLLAYQEKPVSGQPAPQVQIIDKEKAIDRSKFNVLEIMDDPKLDFHLAIQAIGQILYVHRKVMGFEDKPKSRIIIPGK